MRRKAPLRLAALFSLALVTAAGGPAVVRAEGDVRIAFERLVPYSGKAHLAWTSPYAFVDKRGETVGLGLRVTNASTEPAFVLGSGTEVVSVGVETQQEDGAWKALATSAPDAALVPLRVDAGQSFELQVPLPQDTHTLRVSIQCRTIDEPDASKGSWLTVYSDAIDVHRWSTHRAMREPATREPRQASVHEAPRVATPALPPATTVQLAFVHPTPYSGKTHDAWTTSYAFIEKRGVTLGALLRLTNGTGDPVSILGFSRDALSVRVEVRQRNDWRALLIAEASAGLKPLPLAPGESIDLQVPLPDDSRNMRVSIVYRTRAADPDWTTGGWQTVYSDAIDVRRWRK